MRHAKGNLNSSVPLTKPFSEEDTISSALHENTTGMHYKLHILRLNANLNLSKSIFNIILIISLSLSLENESPFTTRTVKIARGVNPEEKYELIRELGRYGN